MLVSVMELFYYRVNYLDVCGRKKNYIDKSSLDMSNSELAGLIESGAKN